MILPDHTYLERWHDDVIYPSLGYPVYAVRQPVIAPLYNTRNTGDLLIELAHRLGGTVKESFPWKDFLELIQFRARGIYESGRGNIRANSFEEFWQKLLEVGFWTDPPYPFGQWERVFKTPSKKFEFFSQKLAHTLEDLAKKKAEHEGIPEEEALDKILTRLKITARGDAAFMPHYEEPRFVGDPKEYPLYLNTYKLMAHAEGRGANSPWLQEILGTHVGRRWETWVEINPTTAQKLGISEGDWVWVESPLGKIKVRAKLHPGAKPDVVNIPFERGHRSYGRWAVGSGANPNAENTVPFAGPEESEKNRPIFWMQLLSLIEGEYPRVRAQFIPRPCMHCDNPPCVQVCPVGATWKAEDGLVVQDYDRTESQSRRP